MKHRAILLPITIATIMALSLSRAWSQEFKPSKQIEAVVHTGPGGGSDLLARAIAELLQKEKLISQRMQVVNKPGGGPAVAMSYLAEKKGETHTIGFFTGVWVTNPLTTAEANVTVKDLTPIVRLVLEPAVIAVKADSPYKNMQDFIEAAKKNPKQLAQSGGTITSRDNLMRLLLQKATGAQWNFYFLPERRRTAVQSARRPCANDGDRAARSRRADSRGKFARHRCADGEAVGVAGQCADDQGARHRRPADSASARSRRAAGQRRVKWCNTGKEFSTASQKTASGSSTWSKISSKTAISKDPALSKFFDDLTVQMRDVLKEAGAKVVR